MGGRAGCNSGTRGRRAPKALTSALAAVTAALLVLAGATPATAAPGTPSLTAADTVAGAPAALSGAGWSPGDIVTVQLVNVAMVPVPGASTTFTVTSTGGFPVPTSGAPVITSIAPASGLLVGGETVTLTGVDLVTFIRVSVNGLWATAYMQTPTQLNVIIPPGVQPGSVPVQVFGLFGISNTAYFTYDPPTATASSPTGAGGSTSVTSSGWGADMPLTVQLL